MERSHVQPDQSSHRHSELPSAKVSRRLKDDLRSSTSARKDRGANNTNTEGTRTLLNGYANYLSDSEDSIRSSLDDDRDRDDNDFNDCVHETDENDNDDDDNVDNDGDNQEIERNGDHKCNNGDDSHDDNDDDDYDEKDGGIGQDASYSCPDANTSVVLDRVNKPLTQVSSLRSHINSSNEEKVNSNDNIDCWPGRSSNNYLSAEKVYEKSGNSSISSEGDDNAARGSSPHAHKEKSPIVSVASNVTSQGARPKTSSQMPVRSNKSHLNLPDGKIPSLDVVGISQGFLARHSTDQSFPYSSSTEDNDLSTSESTSCIDWPQTSITGNDNSSTSWSLPGPPLPDRREPLQDCAYPMSVNPRYGDPRIVGYQPLSPMTGLETGWQLPNQQQPESGRTSSDFLPEDQHISNRAESLLTSRDESSSNPDVLGHFLGASGTQGDDSFNRQPWVSRNYETAWRWPRYSHNRHQTNPSSIGDLTLRNEQAVNSSAVNPPAPAVTLPSVSLPNAGLNLQTAASDTLTSQSSSSTMSGSHNLHLLQVTTFTEDNWLIALERKIAEACAIVERVPKEREEQTRRRREEMQRQREIREQRQRETREQEDIAVAERAPVQESLLWQCEHYQRHCSVRFPCCGVFYPCHHCHNGSGACEADDKKANQATHVKCGSCGHEEEVSDFFCCCCH